MIYFFIFLFWAGLFTYFWLNYGNLNKVLKLVFILKILSSVLFVLVYSYWYSGDLDEYLSIAKLWEGDSIKVILNDFIFRSDLEDFSPRKTFFSKLFFVFYMIGFKNLYVANILFSIISFILILESYKILINKNSTINLSFAIAFLLPTVLFWTSGATKECLTVPAFCFILIFVRYFKKPDLRGYGKLLLFILSLYLIIQLRYFYLPFLVLFIWVFQLEKYWNKFYFWLTSLILVLTYVVSQNILAPQFRLTVIQELIFFNYHTMRDISEVGGYVEIDFPDNTYQSILKASLSSLKGLFFISFKNVFSLLVSLENLFVLVLLVYSVWKDKNKSNSIFLVYACILLLELVFYTLVSPNYGSLSRYRIIYWFFIIWYITEQQKSLPLMGRLFKN